MPLYLLSELPDEATQRVAHVLGEERGIVFPFSTGGVTNLMRQVMDRIERAARHAMQ